jgi:hypothetical protein
MEAKAAERFDIAENLTPEERRRQHHDELIRACDHPVFWYPIEPKKNEAPKMGIDRAMLIGFLQYHGFCKYYTTEIDYIYIRIEGHLTEKVSRTQIKDFVLDFVTSDDFPDPVYQDMVYDALLSGIVRLFNNEFVEALPTRRLNWSADEPGISRLYYQNGVVEIVAAGPELKPYEEIDGYVWKSSIIDRDFEKCDFEKCDFQCFLKMITNHDDDPGRYWSMVSSLGYLIHRKKTGTLSKMIVLVDEKVPELMGDSNGGTGKTLVVKALSHIRNLVIVNGKTWRPDKTFAFASIDMDTDLLLIDETNRGFPWGQLFQMITGDLTTERKHQNPITIPYSDSPKFVAATNRIIAQNDISTRRRVHEIELSDYFSDKHQPIDEFNREFFSGWPEDEWRKFDNFLAFCVMTFFQSGIIEYARINTDRRRIEEATCSEFVEWAEIFFEKDGCYLTNETLERFLRDYSTIKLNRRIPIHRFSVWVKQWCEYKCRKVHNKSIRDWSGSVTRCYQIGDTNSTEIAYPENPFLPSR